MDPEISKDSLLYSVNATIEAALRSGTDSEDISRLVIAAESKIVGRERRKSSHVAVVEHKESGVSFHRLFRYGFLVLAIMISFANILSFAGEQWIAEVAVERTEEIENVKETKTAIVANFLMENLNFQTNVFELPLNNTAHPCPLDVFLDVENEACKSLAGGIVCVFPGAILKRTKNPNELKSHKVLNDTRFFPELYYGDHKCRTLLVENVRPRGESKNFFCANYTYYERFYKSAFDIFNANNIIPRDLNTCCNTIVYDEHIRIIDFGLYKVGKPEEVLKTNEEMLYKLLENLYNDVQKAKGRCESRRQRDITAKRKELEGECRYSDSKREEDLCKAKIKKQLQLYLNMTSIEIHKSAR